MSRLPLFELDDIPEERHHQFPDDYLGDRHVFRVWAHDPEVLEATLEYLNALYDRPGDRRRELVILTVARARGAEYERHQHVDIARDKDGTGKEMQTIGGGDLSVFDAEFVLLQHARVIESGTVTDQINDVLTSKYSAAGIVALGLLVDFYVGLYTYIASVDLPVEEANSSVGFPTRSQFRGSSSSVHVT